jgi:hypothetical protein
MGLVMEGEHPLAQMPAWRAGAWGGSASSLAQFIGTNLTDTVGAGFDAEYVFVMKSLTVFGIATIFLGLLGATVSRFMQMRTKDPFTLFLAGASATAILTMAFPAIKPLIKRVDLFPISEARADDPCSYRSNFTVGKGLKSFFGLDDPQYRVVVGSFKKPDDAMTLASRVNAADPTLKAVVSDPAPCNDFYAVAVGSGEFFPTETARKVQAKALKVDAISGAYLSPER